MDSSVIDNHDWIDDPDEKAGGVLKCRRAGCLLRKAKIGGVWQRKKGGHWRSMVREPLPQCTAIR